ncbi:MAG: PAS-domain containing protein [Methylocystaceae bacterium]|nr:PAS-domain containing protein [Methylocystaceae bacterium]
MSDKKTTALDTKMIINALDHLDQGITIFDCNFKLKLFNHSFEKMFDYPEGFLHIGMNFEEILRWNIQQGEYGPGDPEQQFQERMEELHKFSPHELIRTRPNGTVLKVIGHPLHEGGFVTTYEDITKPHVASKLLEDREEQFRTYLEASPLGAMLVEQDGALRYINTRMLQILGYDESDLPHLNTKDFYYNETDRENFLQTIHNKPTASTIHVLGKKKDGSAIPLLVTAQLMTIKNVERIFSWVNDLTELQKAEETIEQLSAHNDMILAAAGAGIFGLDTKDNIQFINPAAATLLGYHPDELRGKKISVILHNKDNVTDITRTGVQSGETEMAKKSGNTFPAKFTVSQLQNGDEVSGKVIVFDDISERVAAEQVLRQAMKDIEDSSRAKSHFISTMSHELRTPLNAILGFAQILNSNPQKNLNEQQLNFINHMFKAGEHLLKLINEAIDISSIEYGQISLSKQSINLNEIIADCIHLCKDLAQEKNVTVSTGSVQEEHPLVIADYARLQQIIMHLLTNAIKFNKENGSVTVYCEKTRRDTYKVTVRDTGRGIPSNNQSNIFEPFNRLNAHSEGIEGTGLGLTLSKHLTNLMGGEIGYLTKEDIGSDFWIEFPCAQLDSPILVK